MTSAIRRSAMPASGRWTPACKAHGGFDHNAQTLRVVTSLEHRYPEFDGLNLTWESLEGIVKHNGPLTDARRQRARALSRPRRSRAGFPTIIGIYDLELWSFASLEAQVAAIADDIAYDAHDIDDGLRAGLFGVDDLKVMPLTAEMIAEIDSRYPGLDDDRRGAELVRELISLSDRRGGLGSAPAARGRPAAIGRRRPPSWRCADRVFAAVAQAEAEIKAFLKQRMYRHPRVMRVMGEAETDRVRPVRALPEDAGRSAGGMAAAGRRRETETERARRIGNFIAGMTDRFALTEHQRLFDSTPDLR